MIHPPNHSNPSSPPAAFSAAPAPLGSGVAADIAASTRKHISDCQIPARSLLHPEERPSTFCFKESINIFDRIISFS